MRDLNQMLLIQLLDLRERLVHFIGGGEMELPELLLIIQVSDDALPPEIQTRFNTRRVFNSMVFWTLNDESISRGRMVRNVLDETITPLIEYLEVRTSQRRHRDEDHDGSMEPPPAKTAKFW